MSASINNPVLNLFRELALVPDSSILWNELGRHQRSLGSPTPALVAAARAVSIDPSFAANLLSLGVMLYESGYRLDAIDRFLESLVSMPASAEAWLALGVAEKTATRSARAYDCLIRALTLREVYPEASAQIAALFFQMRRPEDALAAATQAVHQSPQSLPAWATQGQVLRMLLRPLAAEPCFQRCVVWQPAMAEYWVNLGIVRQMQDFFD